MVKPLEARIKTTHHKDCPNCHGEGEWWSTVDDAYLPCTYHPGVEKDPEELNKAIGEAHLIQLWGQKP